MEEPSGYRKRRELQGDNLRRRMLYIEENVDDDDFDEIHGNTYCRIVYDAPKCYPGLSSIFPTNVFTKLYNWPVIVSENFPGKDEYYDLFVNELEINEILVKSEFATNFLDSSYRDT